MLRTVYAPARAMRAAAERGSIRAGLWVVALWAAIQSSFALYSAWRAGEWGFPPVVQGDPAVRAVLFVSVTLLLAVGPFAYWLALSALMQLGTRLFGGSGGFRGTTAVVGLACVPVAIGVLAERILVVAVPGPQAGYYWIAWPLLAWHAALVVVGVGIARRVDHGLSAASCCVSCLGLAALAAAAAFAFILAFGLATG